jgi:hypothetical protein
MRWRCSGSRPCSLGHRRAPDCLRARSGRLTSGGSPERLWWARRSASCSSTAKPRLKSERRRSGLASLARAAASVRRPQPKRRRRGRPPGRPTEPCEGSGGRNGAVGLPALDDFKQFDAPMPLRELVIVDPASPCVGMSVAAVLAEANLALGSCAAQLPAGALSDCAAMINESFVDGEAAARRSAAIAWRPPSPGLGRRRRRRASPTSASYAWETANCPTAATRRAVKRVTWPATTASVQTACTARPDAVCRAPADPLASAAISSASHRRLRSPVRRGSALTCAAQVLAERDPFRKSTGTAPGSTGLIFRVDFSCDLFLMDRGGAHERQRPGRRAKEVPRGSL